ncbi:MAG: tRNA (adenosine(37)-N6)-threonylcarbamoyltransferase complex dimerization subunit type 1 TsaB [Alphaproteobacteria bacterium]|nr:tRNA (adenosine(37)-N6)-threonylcarbamoyltransferase complex dimerization subunit type 1 TsaB [Alphaproteobacteria bacterium]
MIVLALDCSAAACSVAIWCGSGPDDGAIVAHLMTEAERGHAGLLMPMIADVLDHAGLTYADLDRLAATVGPGSYTGIRIGLAAARGLALATAKPLIGVTATRAVAAAVARAHGPDLAAAPSLAVALETKRDDLYLQGFGSDLTPLTEPQAVLPDEAAASLPAGTVLVAGNAAERLVAAAQAMDRSDVASLAGHNGLPDAVDVAVLAAAAPEPASPPAPLYLRPPDVTVAGQRKS